MSEKDLPYWVALRTFPQFGARRMKRLIAHFPSMEAVFRATAVDFLDAGIEPDIANRFLQEKIHIDPDAVYAQMRAHDVYALTVSDETYPSRLKQLFDPPAVLFCRGELPTDDASWIAVVGSRKATHYGLRATEKLVKPLAQSGAVIVSGLAYGIDAAAHEAAISASGTTVAVLGTGVDTDSIYPSAHRNLASRILASGGALISEFPIGTPPLKRHFPLRNRIIAGLCESTLVVEAAKKSGSLITAKAALEANRDVFAVPGPITSPLSEGPHELLKDGAIPATEALDILEHADTLEEDTFSPSTDEEAHVYRLLGMEPIHLDEITRLSDLPVSKTSTIVTTLELNGGIRHVGGKYYARLA